MRRATVNAVLLVTAVALAALALAWRPDYSRPNVEFLPDMVHQPRFDAYEANPYFPDGATLHAPVPGTVPRGGAPLGYGPGEAEAARAGRELRSPIAEGAHEAALARGKVVYGRFCGPCHGEGGAGDGPVALRGFPPPPRLDAPEAVARPDGEIFHIVTFGRGNMPGYGPQITREDRWNVVLYVRSLQRGKAGR